LSTPQRTIVIGASAGGVEALREVVAKLPADLNAALFVVLHIPPYVASSLPKILSRAGPLRAVHPEDGASVRAGTIYVAPPDHHLLLEGQRIGVKKGPKENRFRPSIDALFRSAAHACGPRAIGVVLSGALDDGTSGLWSIKRLGGIAIVQQPNEARFESMPRSALEYVEVDHTLPSPEIGALLARLVAEPPPKEAAMETDERTRMDKEVAIAAEAEAYQKGIMELGALTPFTCPSATASSCGSPKGKCPGSAATPGTPTPTAPCSRR